MLALLPLLALDSAATATLGACAALLCWLAPLVGVRTPGDSGDGSEREGGTDGANEGGKKGGAKSAVALLLALFIRQDGQDGPEAAERQAENR